MYVIDVNGLTKVYKTKGKTSLTALDDISFQVKSGIILGYLGPNGAGKTTTVRILSTVLKPTKGTIYVCGFDLYREPKKIRERIGVSQQGRALDLFLSVNKNLLIYGKIHKIPSNELKSRIRWYLKEMDLWEYRNKPVATLSGGLMRRVQLIRAFLHNPELVFLDEPTLGLDPRARRHVWEFILTKKKEATIFLTTNSMEEAEFLSDEVIILFRGKIIARGDPNKLREIVSREMYTTVKLQITNGNQSVIKDILDNFGSIAEWKQAEDKYLILKMHQKEFGESLTELISAIKRAKIKILDVEVLKPKLEDVFLKLTGGNA